MSARSILCVFAKPPRPGRVKTRLAPVVGESGAAELARAFLQDTWSTVRALPWARPVLATTEIATGDLMLEAAETWLQGDGDLGDRLERILSRALEQTPLAFAIGTDTPGIPVPLLVSAHEALSSADAVLGPCDDGGFYLIGLRKCPVGLLRDLPWSAPDTFDRTLGRLHDRGLMTTVLPSWFDVDRPSDLDRLQGLLDRGEISAPETARMLAQVHGVRLSVQAPACP